jgi:hypothetical protein
VRHAATTEAAASNVSISAEHGVVRPYLEWLTSLSGLPLPSSQKPSHDRIPSVTPSHGDADRHRVD